MNWQLLLDYVNRVAVQSLFSQQQLTTVNPCFGETLNLQVALLQSLSATNSANNGGQLWNPQSLSGWTIRAAIGQIGVQPVAGTYTLTYEASDTTTETTGNIAYNANATAIAAALNAGAKMTAAGGCTVTAAASGYFLITFNTPSPQFQITADAGDLVPESLIETGILIPGTTSPAVQCVQSFYILQNPAAYANLTTASSAASITCTALTVGSAGPLIVNATYSVTMNQNPYGGQFTLTVAGCITGLLSYNAPPRPGLNSAILDVQTALSNLTQVSGALIVGIRYTIVNFVTSDDFSNVGGSNVTGAVFTASGTTPTNWSHGSTLTPVGTGNVTVLQNSNGGYIVGFQGQLSGIAMGTMTGDATSLQVIPTLGGSLSLATTGMQLLLGAQASVNAIFEIEGTPSGGAPVKLFRGAVTILAPVISPASTTPSPIAVFYTQSQSDARYGQLAAANTWTAANTLTGLTLTLGSHATGDIIYDTGSGVYGRLAIGSSSPPQYLGVVGGLPAWITLGAQLTIDTGWTANADSGSKTASIPANSGTIQAALNVVSPGAGDAFVAVQSKVKAIEAALVGKLLPNA
jgi:hypothetical protein